jgi:glycerol-3-phosphate O-acyltransferase
VRDRVQKLSRLFKFEFRFRADATFDQIFDDTLETMQRAGELLVGLDGRLDAGPGRFGWSGREWLLTYAAFLHNFLESYRIAARGLAALLKGPLAEKELVKKALLTGRRMYFTGEIERREAVSQPTVTNAVQAFLDHGDLVSSNSKLELSDPTPEAVRAVEARVERYLPREVPA